MEKIETTKINWTQPDHELHCFLQCPRPATEFLVIQDEHVEYNICTCAPCAALPVREIFESVCQVDMVDKAINIETALGRAKLDKFLVDQEK